MSIYQQNSTVTLTPSEVLAYLKLGAVLRFHSRIFYYSAKTLRYNYRSNEIPGYRTKPDWRSNSLAMYMPELERLCRNFHTFTVETPISRPLLRSKPCKSEM